MWKVFNKEGKDFDLSKNEILSLCEYWILMLHSPDFPQNGQNLVTILEGA
jgi:hypothetical protein